jgi:hypothetical protein
MENKPIWKVADTERYSSDGCIFRIVYCAMLVDGETSLSNCDYIFLEKQKDFIPFEDLTEEIIISWIKERLGQEKVSSIELNLIENMKKQKNDVPIFGLPWRT